MPLILALNHDVAKFFSEELTGAAIVLVAVTRVVVGVVQGERSRTTTTMMEV